MHFAAAKCHMHETVVPFEFRSLKKKTWNNIIQLYEKLPKTRQKPWKIEHDVTWLLFRRVLTGNWAAVLATMCWQSFCIWKLPQPIPLQNGTCIGKVLKAFENMVCLQNGYLFFREGISFKIFKEYHKKPLQNGFLSVTKWLVVVPKNDHTLNIKHDITL